MADELYGVVEAQRRAREWMPHLKTPGQRIVYGALLTFFSIDGTATPTAGQLAELSGMHPSSVRKILGQLEKDLGAVMRVGSRPNLTADGVSLGGHGIPVWTFTKRASEGALASAPRGVPSAPYRGTKRASEGAPLKVEKLKGEILKEQPDEEWFEKWNRGEVHA